MKTELANKLSRNIHKIGFNLKQQSPTIFVVAGTIGVVASAVMACKATTKIDTVLEPTKEKVEQIHTYVEEHGYSEQYTEKDKQKDLALVYAKTGVGFAKLYGPSIALGALSIGSILLSHKIMTKRNIALASAYATIDGSFKDYRKRVVEKFGEQIDNELKYDLVQKEVIETVKDENGEEKEVTNNITLTGYEDVSGYARFFDETSEFWTSNSEYNLKFLKDCEAYANKILQSRGYLYLNEVYKMIGVVGSEAGQTVGWVYDEKHPIGDNKVVFKGIYDVRRKASREFVNGYEASVLIDFNVDGNISNRHIWK